MFEIALDVTENIIYNEGMNAGLSPKHTECPYLEGSLFNDFWFDGFGDGTDAVIANKEN